MQILMRIISMRILLFTLFISTPFALMAQKDSAEVWSVNLDSVVVTSHRYTSGVKVDAHGDFRWRMQMLDELPKLLGNADPIHYAQMLPGIQTNSEYTSGVHIQGCESSHNSITINGVAIHNANHLLGFFSVFNAPHFSTMHISKSVDSGEASNRLGGMLAMETDTILPDTICGEASVGLISSQTTLHAPIGKRSALHISFRTSYINMLYGSWLKMENSQLQYSFYDVNATIVHKHNHSNLWMIDWYMGQDVGHFNDKNYVAVLNAKWANMMGAVHWIYSQQGLDMKQTVYVSSYRNRFGLEMDQLSFLLPSYRTDVGWKMTLKKGCWKMGGEMCRHFVKPQQLKTDANFVKTQKQTQEQQAWEGGLFLDYYIPLGSHMTMITGARMPLYFINGYEQSPTVDPTVSLLWEGERNQLSFSAFSRHQYLFQTGFSDAGLPTEFWLLANKNYRPQSAMGIQITASSFLLNKRYRLTIDLYHKRLKRQMEYTGTILDFVNKEYDINQWVEQGKGENYGFSLMLNKCSGKVTGWVNLSYTHARRTFSKYNANLDGTFPASHERPVEVNTVVTYNHNKKWNFGATVVYASGTPFTAPKSLALVNGYVVTQYCSHNGARLKPYFRTDLSANYRWKGKRLREQGINFSLYNATCHANNLFYHVKTTKDGKLGYKEVSFVMFALPSISYFCKF